MAVRVVGSREEIRRARGELRRRGLDCLTPLPARILEALRLARGTHVGDPVKSWDILETVRFVEHHVPRESPVLDMGAAHCEMLPVLHRLGYFDLTGIDLDPAVRGMPHAHAIRYVVGDFTATPFADGSFACATAISAIEHGFDAGRLLPEVARVLRPGGFFVASVDYWPEKIDTTGITPYGMTWTIFSRDELRSTIEKALRYGLAPVGEAHYEARERVARWMGKEYTFAWLALRKVPRPASAGT